jgi:ABC-2 type transport system ATP-binding protein
MSDVVMALEAVGLSKRYWRGPRALDNLSLGVPAGSITALVGPNAAGKSTLMKTWVGFERPSNGRVLVHGIDPWADPSSALSHIGYVPQQPALYRGLSVMDHLDYTAHVRPRFDRDAAARHLAELGIPRAARASTLSGGQAAQLMLAIALNVGADTYILDEPLAALDPLARDEFLRLLRDTVRARGATAILSSHIVTDIERTCDHLIVLGIGRAVLNISIADALASHRVLPGVRSTGDSSVTVATLTSASGQIESVVRIEPRSTGLDDVRAASLDEIVKAYLSTGRPARTASVLP